MTESGKSNYSAVVERPEDLENLELKTLCRIDTRQEFGSSSSKNGVHSRNQTQHTVWASSFQAGRQHTTNRSARPPTAHVSSVVIRKKQSQSCGAA